MTTAEITDALRAAARGEARARLMAWEGRAEVGRRLGRTMDTTITELAGALTAESAAVVEKGQGWILSGGICPNGGRRSEWTTRITSMLFDSDKSGDSGRITTLLDAAGIGYYCQVRGDKFHVRIFFAEALLPSAQHKALLQHVFCVFEAASGIVLDQTQANGLAPEEFLYTARPDLPGVVVRTTFAEGAGLDVLAFARETGFTGRHVPQAPPPDLLNLTGAQLVAALLALKAPSEADWVVMTPDETRAGVNRLIARNKRPERHSVLQALRTGKEIGTRGGERTGYHMTMLALCSWIAWATEGRADEGTVLEMLAPSLAAMAPTHLDTEMIGNETCIERILRRAMADARRKIPAARESDARMRQALTRSLRDRLLGVQDDGDITETQPD